MVCGFKKRIMLIVLSLIFLQGAIPGFVKDLVIAAAEYQTVDTSADDAMDAENLTAPEADTILEDFADMQNVHPRILATAEDFSAIRENISANDTMREWYLAIKALADYTIKLVHNSYTFSDDGNILDVSRSVLQRSYTLGMMYQLTGETKYAEYLWGEYQAVFSFPDWNSSHFLDTAEMTNAVAIGYDWCYDYWTEEQKQTIEENIKTMGLDQGRAAYDEAASWVTAVGNNWNFVCNGGLAVGALALLDVYPEFCAQIISDSLDSMKYGLDSFAPDGAWPEGMNYWNLALSYCIYEVASLNTTLGTDYGYFNVMGLKKTGYFLTYMQSSQGVFNFNDCTGTVIHSEECFYLANRCGDAALNSIHLKEMKEYGITPTALDLLYYNPNLNGTMESVETDAMFGNAEIASFRSGFFDEEALFATIHGGYNSVNHGDLDAGTFVLDALGERWAEELGPDSYALSGYWGITNGKRWDYYRKNAQGQNVIAMNPVSTNGQLPEGNAKVTKFVSKDQGGYAVVDTTSVYGSALFSQRGIKMDHNRSQVLLQDELRLTESVDLWWFMHTKAEIEISSNQQSAMLTKNGKQLYVVLSSNHPSAVFTTTSATPLDGSADPAGQNANEEYVKLCVNIPDAEGDISIAVRFIPIASAEIEQELIEGAETEITPIEDWEIADEKMPVLSSLCLNGKEIDHFSANKFNYTILLESEEIPRVTASAGENTTVSVSALNENDAGVTVIVRNNAVSSEPTVYVIKFKRVNGVRTINEDFERYTSFTDFINKNKSGTDGAIWTSLSDLTIDGCTQELVNFETYAGIDSKALHLCTPKELSACTQALSASSLNFSGDMTIRFDMMLESISQGFQLVLRDDDSRWVWMLDKNEDTTTLEMFGTVIERFSFTENTPYEFICKTSYDEKTNIMTYSLWINGTQYVVNGKAFYGQYFSNKGVFGIQKLKMKFQMSHTADSAEDAGIYLDNICIEPNQTYAQSDSVRISKAVFYRNGQLLENTAQLYAGDTLSFIADAEMLKEGSIMAIMTVKDKTAGGRLKDVQCKIFPGESTSVAISLAMTLSEDAAADDVCIYLWDGNCCPLCTPMEPGI